MKMALFIDNFANQQYTSTCARGSFGLFVIFARNCLAFVFNSIVMQMKNVICEKGY